jgi:hypothetical protein
MKFRSRKKQGEWVEQLFVLMVLALGLQACRPIGDSDAYDITVENPVTGTRKRVQVKSVSVAGESVAFAVNCGRGCDWKRTYTAKEVDLIAAYVLPEKTWYVIPVKEVRRLKRFRVRPQSPQTNYRFERFKEAWQLVF